MKQIFSPEIVEPKIKYRNENPDMTFIFLGYEP